MYFLLLLSQQLTSIVSFIKILGSKKSDKPTYAIENEKCTSVFLPDGENCAKYFDCTLNSIQECPYPLLFDEDIKRCVPPEKANCGSRTAVKDPCK